MECARECGLLTSVYDYNKLSSDTYIACSFLKLGGLRQINGRYRSLFSQVPTVLRKESLAVTGYDSSAPAQVNPQA